MKLRDKIKEEIKTEVVFALFDHRAEFTWVAIDIYRNDLNPYYRVYVFQRKPVGQQFELHGCRMEYTWDTTKEYGDDNLFHFVLDKELSAAECDAMLKNAETLVWSMKEFLE